MIPFEERWLSLAEVAILLGYEKRTAAKRVLLADFPKPRRDGHPRWLAKEVMAWADKQRWAA
jgi:predicted DNA-binding transcriptional regulator AlpA